MRKAVLSICLFIFSGAAAAAANCAKHPKSEWLSEADAKARIEAQGYKISRFKVDGNCYEIYGYDRDGNRAEVYFDTKTLAIVKSEIRKKK